MSSRKAFIPVDAIMLTLLETLVTHTRRHAMSGGGAVRLPLRSGKNDMARNAKMNRSVAMKIADDSVHKTGAKGVYAGSLA